MAMLMIFIFKTNQIVMWATIIAASLSTRGLAFNKLVLKRHSFICVCLSPGWNKYRAYNPDTVKKSSLTGVFDMFSRWLIHRSWSFWDGAGIFVRSSRLSPCPKHFPTKRLSHLITREPFDLSSHFTCCILFIFCNISGLVLSFYSSKTC